MLPKEHDFYKHFKCLYTLERHPEYLISLTISSDGKVLTSSCYNLLKIWDLEQGTLICSHKHSKRVTGFSLIISPDWETFIIAWDNRIEVRDLLTGEMVRYFLVDSVISIAITPDGQALVAGKSAYRAGERNELVPITCWNLQTGQPIRTMQGHHYSVSSVIISPDGKKLVSQSHHFSTKVWDLQTGQELHSFNMPPRHWIDSVAITSNQELIVSGVKFSDSVAHTLEVWNVETDQIICVFPGSWRCNFGRPHSVMTPDGKILVSGDDTDIKVWSLQTAEELCTLQGHENRVEYLAITPNGQTIVSYGEDGIRVWGL